MKTRLRKATSTEKPVPERVRVRLELRRSNAAQPHRNRRREMKRPGKGNRKAWKQEEW